jgi:ornithine cyclodeaminase/alanine dehydrogenase-like protein (mu-crystallin family)
VIAGNKPGRHTDDDVIIFDSTGTAVQDTTPAAAVYLSTPDAPKTNLWSN